MPSSAFKFGPATFFTSPFCPYAQRVSIALLETGLIDSIQAKENPSGVKVTEIDLKNKPDWYVRDINPSGKVPAFQITQADQQKSLLVESDMIAQFVLLTQGSPLLQTTLSDPYLHYRAQSFMATFQPFTGGFYAVLKAKQPEQLRDATAALLATLQTISAALDPVGPFTLGPRMLWPDVLAASFLMRLPILKHYRQFEVPATFARIHAWIHACSAVESVQKSTAKIDELIAFYAFMAV